MTQYNQSGYIYNQSGAIYNQDAVDRTATGSGVGSATADKLRTALRTATGSGAGASSVTQLLTVVRSGNASAGTGSSAASRVITRLRTATASGQGTATSTAVRVVIRSSTGAGQGTSTGIAFISFLRTATGQGSGTGLTVSAIIFGRSADGSGVGDYVPSEWVKSHIFRIPYTYNYPGATYRDEGAANRLQRYNRTNVRVRNLYKLTDGSYTTIDQRDQGQVVKVWQGGHEHFLTDAEVVELTTAGFGASIT